MTLAAGDNPEGARGRLLPLLATLAAPVAGYFAFRSAVAAVMPAAVLFADLPPQDHRPSLTATMRLAQIPQQKVTPQMAETARAGLRSTPLAYEPFYILARAEEQAGRVGRATRLMEEARRRRPTHPAIRMQLLVYYTQQARYAEALVEMDLLMRRNEDLRRLLLPELVKMLAVREGRDALARILATEPEWREHFYAVAAQREVDPADARALLEGVRARKPGGDVALERQLVLQALAGAGRYGEARQQWLQGLPADERGRHATVFNGAFGGMAAPKPFGWDLQDLDVGRAEIVRDGERAYLDVIHFGGRDIALAEQVLALPPGRHRLTLVARADGEIGERRLLWRVACLPSGNVLGTLDLGAAKAGPTRLSTEFTVPASGCAGQKLMLIGQAGERAGVAAAQVERVEIAR
ncbi:MAG: hypothetical protein ACK40O_06355 [Allosphingosinicella sp.]